LGGIRAFFRRLDQRRHIGAATGDQDGDALFGHALTGQRSRRLRSATAAPTRAVEPRNGSTSRLPVSRSTPAPAEVSPVCAMAPFVCWRASVLGNPRLCNGLIAAILILAWPHVRLPMVTARRAGRAGAQI